MANKPPPEPPLEPKRTSGIARLRDPHRDKLTPASEIVPGFAPNPTAQETDADPPIESIMTTSDEPTWLSAQPGDAEGHRALPKGVLLVVGLVIIATFNVLVAVRSDDEDGSATASGEPVGVRFLDIVPPQEAREVGSYTESRIDSNGEVRVTQWIRSRQPLAGVRLRMPSLPGVGSAQATDLLVAADRRILAEPQSLGAAGGQVIFATPARVVYLSYTLKGVLERSPSARGRALVPATALTVDYTPRTGPARLTLMGDTVLSAACSATASASPRPCGAPSDGSWIVMLHGAERGDSVAAQVNLS